MRRARAGRSGSTMPRSLPPRWMRRPSGLASRTGRPALARELQISDASVARAWRRYLVQPWRRETFKFSTDPELEAKVQRRRRALPRPARERRSCSASTRRARSRRSTAPSRSCRSGRACRRRPPTTTPGTAPRRCLPRSRSRPAGHRRLLRAAPLRRVPALPETVARAYPRRRLCLVVDNYQTHKHPAVNAWLQGSRGSRCTSPRPRLLAQPSRGLLLDHQPPSDPPRQLRQRPRPRRRDPPLHRRLERALPALRLDENRRRHPHPHPSTNFKRATLGCAGRHYGCLQTGAVSAQCL